ncbi:MAG: alkyl hydroperoxide reductase [Bacteroidetes bacterium MED-G17]|nr:MAG: alkyl hydroperoxide reductase [Bacteroidetes bacterium MED-G17]
MGCSQVWPKKIHQKKGQVFMVMVPDCPLSQSYSTPFLRLKKKYENSLDFFLVVPAKFYQKNEIKNFINMYNIPENMLFIDKNNQLASEINATISPEFFLFDSAKNVKYQGAFDDWVEDLGSKRIVRKTNNFLSLAIDSFLNGTRIKNAYKQAEGCYIEY